MGEPLEKINLYFFHGFLGQTSDWSEVLYSMQNSQNIVVHLVNLWDHESLSPSEPLKSWANKFNHWASQQQGKHYLVGYSMGGRLALQVFHADPSLWNRVMIVSANTGLTSGVGGDVNSSTERQERWAADQKWAQRFRQDNWSNLLKDWNSQLAFQGSVNEPERAEDQYDREALAQALTQWSLALQGDLLPGIAEHGDRCHWVVGSRDQKYLQIAQSVKDRCPQIPVQVIEGSAHRILFDQPQKLAECIEQMLQK